jgi:hypothetical protein
MLSIGARKLRRGSGCSKMAGWSLSDKENGYHRGNVACSRISSRMLYRGMRSGVVVERGVTRGCASQRSLAQLLVHQSQSASLDSSERSSWELEFFAVVCTVGSAPIPRCNTVVCGAESSCRERSQEVALVRDRSHRCSFINHTQPHLICQSAPVGN